MEKKKIICRGAALPVFTPVSIYIGSDFTVSEGMDSVKDTVMLHPARTILELFWNTTQDKVCFSVAEAIN